MSFLARVVVYAIAAGVTAYLLPGITIGAEDAGSYLIIGLVFGLVSAIVKPIVTLLTCPLVIVTMGLFIFVINGLMLLITSELLGDRFMVDGLGTAILGGIVMGITSLILESLLGKGLKED